MTVSKKRAGRDLTRKGFNYEFFSEPSRRSLLHVVNKAISLSPCRGFFLYFARGTRAIFRESLFLRLFAQREA